MPTVRRQHILFSGQLGFTVNTDRLRFVFFRVRRAFLPIEDGIGAEVNQLCAFLAAISNGCLPCRQSETAATVSIPSCALEQRLPPRRIINVPLNSFLQAFLETAARFPV